MIAVAINPAPRTQHSYSTPRMSIESGNPRRSYHEIAESRVSIRAEELKQLVLQLTRENDELRKEACDKQDIISDLKAKLTLKNTNQCYTGCQVSLPRASGRHRRICNNKHRAQMMNKMTKTYQYQLYLIHGVDPDLARVERTSHELTFDLDKETVFYKSATEEEFLLANVVLACGSFNYQELIMQSKEKEFIENHVMELLKNGAKITAYIYIYKHNTDGLSQVNDEIMD